MPEVDYRYIVTVGSHTWDHNMGDAATYGPVDGLTITRKLTDSPLWPGQVDVAECAFQLIVATADELADVEIGTPVSVDIRRPHTRGAPGPEQFSGRVADITAQPHPLGMLFTVNCLDYTADLRETTVGDEPWPAESVFLRIQRIMGLVGWPLASMVPVNGVLYPINIPTVAARDVDAQNAYDLVQSYLSQWPMDYGPTIVPDHGYARPQIAAGAGGSGETVTTVTLPYAFENPAYGPPLMLVLDGTGKYAATPVQPGVTAPDGVELVPGDEVDYAATYAITKNDAPRKVTVTSSAWDGQVVATLGDPPYVNAPVETELVDTGDATKLAGMYLPGYEPVARWVADSFVWRLELADAGDQLPVSLGTVVTIGPVPEDQNPNGKTWQTGQLASVVYTVADKRPYYTFTLRRPDFATDSSGDSISWGAIGLVGKTWDNISPTDTWDDYRLVRGTTT